MEEVHLLALSIVRLYALGTFVVSEATKKRVNLFIELLLNGSAKAVGRLMKVRIVRRRMRMLI